MENYVAFISYRTSCSVNADLVQQALIGFGYPKKRIFLDKHSIYNENFKKKIAAAISTSSVFILLVTKDCFVARKKEGETDYFFYEIHQAIAEKTSILPIFFDGIQSLEQEDIIKYIKAEFSPEEIEYLCTRNGIKYDSDYGGAGAIGRLKEVIEKSEFEEVDNEVDQECKEQEKSSNSKLKGILFGILGIITFFLLVVTAFASVGFLVGYCSIEKDADEAWESVVTSGNVVIESPFDLRVTIGDLSFRYSVVRGMSLPMTREFNFYESLTFDNVMIALSVPLAFKGLFLSTKYIKNGKAMVAYLVVGSLGILCGYTIGKRLGDMFANYRLVRNMETYLASPEGYESIEQLLRWYNEE